MRKRERGRGSDGNFEGCNHNIIKGTIGPTAAPAKLQKLVKLNLAAFIEQGNILSFFRLNCSFVSQPLFRVLLDFFLLLLSWSELSKEIYN